MIFQHTWEKVLSGEKTQTRRIVKPKTVFPSNMRSTDNTDGDWMWHGKVFTASACKPGTGYWGLGYTEARIKYEVGKTYAVQPGRGKKAVARIRILSIRREDVREISGQDVKAEGFDNRVAFMNVWLQMHDPEIYEIYRDYRFPHQEYKQAAPFLRSRPAERYDAWALTFEVVK